MYLYSIPFIFQKLIVLFHLKMEVILSNGARKTYKDIINMEFCNIHKICMIKFTYEAIVLSHNKIKHTCDLKGTYVILCCNKLRKIPNTSSTVSHNRIKSGKTKYKPLGINSNNKIKDFSYSLCYCNNKYINFIVKAYHS